MSRIPFLLIFVAFLSLPAQASVQAQLDRVRVEPGEAVVLTLERSGRGDGQPDLTPLRQDFDVLGRASGSSVQIVNGHMSARVELRLTLVPRHAGRIPVPSLEWEGERSPALVLDVGGAAGGKPGAPSGHVFISTSVDQKQPFVQAATPLKLRLHTDQPLYQASLDLAASNDVLIQQVGKDRQVGETRGGRRYQVIERDYLLFPQRSGRISLPGPVLDAQVADPRAGNPMADDPFFARAFGNVFGHNPFAGMMNVTRPLHLQADPILLDVRPLPKGSASRDWLPAEKVDLEENWRPPGRVHAGEPITRHLRLAALGLTAAQLPDVAAMMPLPPGFKAYPDQAALKTDTSGGTVRGSREQDVALIAERPGRYALPALHLAWWDTTGNRPREAILPAHTLEVLPGTVVAPAPPAPASAAVGAGPAAAMPAARIPPAKATPWPGLSLVLGLLWLVTLAAWWRSRRTRSFPATPGKAAEPGRAGTARQAFRQACAADDANAARRHLLAWARLAWPDAPPGGLHALAERLEDPRLRALLRELDRACYGAGAWRGAALAAALPALPAAARGKAGKAVLASLYP